jgi:hypothetical protein
MADAHIVDEDANQPTQGRPSLLTPLQTLLGDSPTLLGRVPFMRP